MEYLTHFMAVLSGVWVGYALALWDFKRREVPPERMLDLLDRAYLAGTAQKLARTPETASAELYRLLREKTRATQGVQEPYQPPASPEAAAVKLPVESLEFSGSIEDFELNAGGSYTEMDLWRDKPAKGHP